MECGLYRLCFEDTIMMRSAKYTQNDIEAKTLEISDKFSNPRPIRIPNNIYRVDVERGEVCLDIY